MRLGEDAGPLSAGREGRAAAADELRRRHLLDHPGRPELESAGEGPVAAVRAVVVEAGRVDPADAGEQAKVVVARLRDGRPDRSEALGEGGSPPPWPPSVTRVLASSGVPAPGRPPGPSSVTRLSHLPAGRRCPRRRPCDGEGPGRLAGDREEGRRGALALPEAWAPQPGRRPSSAGSPAGPSLRSRSSRAPRPRPAGRRCRRRHGRRPAGGCRREQRVERGDAVRLGRRHAQPPADVGERGLADVPDPRLDRMECRQEQVPVGARLVAAVGDVAVDRRVANAALPAAPGRPDDRREDAVDRRALGGGRQRRDHVEVHRGQCNDGSAEAARPDVLRRPPPPCGGAEGPTTGGWPATAVHRRWCRSRRTRRGPARPEPGISERENLRCAPQSS